MELSLLNNLFNAHDSTAAAKIDVMTMTQAAAVEETRTAL